MKVTYVLVAVSFLVLISASVAYAPLSIDVSVEYSQINVMQDQSITATANERGSGLLLVIQPAEGTPWLDFLNEHPVLVAAWNMLSNEIQTEIEGRIGGRIVSFETISTSLGGGSETVTFPDDFTGINGIPSTTMLGDYHVVFAFLSYERTDGDANSWCDLFEVDFNCMFFNVIPEVPFGTIVSLLSMIIALPIFKNLRTRRFR